MALNQFLPQCPRCKADGTIVEMKLCCRVAEMDRQNMLTEKFKPLPWRRGRLRSAPVPA